MPRETRRVGGVQVVFKVFDLNLGVSRRMGSSVKIKGGRQQRGDVSISNTYFARVDGVELDVATRDKSDTDTKSCTQAEFWLGVSATITGEGDVSPGPGPDAAVDGVKAAAVVTVNGSTERFSGRA